jgi:hypothetical protein
MNKQLSNHTVWVRRFMKAIRQVHAEGRRINNESWGIDRGVNNIATPDGDSLCAIGSLVYAHKLPVAGSLSYLIYPAIKKVFGCTDDFLSGVSLGFNGDNYNYSEETEDLIEGYLVGQTLHQKCKKEGIWN